MDLRFEDGLTLFNSVLKFLPFDKCVFKMLIIMFMFLKCYRGQFDVIAEWPDRQTELGGDLRTDIVILTP